MANDMNSNTANTMKDILRERGPDDIRRIRRRIEDVLRKSDAKTILGAARFLGIKTEIDDKRGE